MIKKVVDRIELERRKEIVLWQISIAKDPKIIFEKQERFKQLEKQIKELTK